MKEILTIGDVTNDFARLGVELRQTYKGKKYGVCEVTEEEYDLLHQEVDVKENWTDCGWCETKMSEKDTTNGKAIVNGKNMIAWMECDEVNHYDDLLSYLCEQMAVSTPIFVCRFAKELARANDMKMGELFGKYQG